MTATEVRTRTVVHVGSDETIVRDAVNTLNSHGTVSVVSAGTADEALRILETEPVNCLVCENALPEMSGVSLVSSALETDPSLRCLLVTSEAAVVDDALAVGVSDVVVRREAVDTTALMAHRLDTALSARNRSLEEIAVAVPADVYAINHSGTITDAVPDTEGVLSEMFSTPTSLVGDRLSTVLTPTGHRGLEGILKSFADEKQDGRTTFTATLHGENGDTVPCEVSLVSVSPRTDPSATHVAFVRDTSEQRAREKELTAERDFSELLLDTLDDVFYLVGPDGNLERWNNRFREVTGYTDRELSEMHAIDFFDDADKERVAETITETLETGTGDVEAGFITKDGEAITYDFTGAKLTDTDGTLRGLVGIGRDISERKKRERHLERERDRISAAFDSMPYPFVHVTFEDAVARVQRVNDAFENVFGFDRQEVLGSSLSDYIVPDRTDQEARDAIRQLLDGDSVKEELVRETADGELRDFLLKSTPLVREDGTIEGVAAYVDITEQKERIEKLEQIKQSVTDVIWMTTPTKSSMDFISDSYEDVWGRSPASLLENPSSFLDAIHPDDRQRVTEALEDQQEHPDRYRETYRVVQPDGEVRWVNDRSSGVYDDDGTLTRIVGVASDITERKQREQELELKNRAMDEAPIGITIHDTASPMNDLRYANAGFETLTGYGRSQIDGTGLSLLTGADTELDRLEQLERSFDREEPASVVLLLYRHDAEPFWGRFSIAPVTDDRGDVTHFVVFLQNVTETKEHEQEIERRLSEFGEVLAQDLRTPVETAQRTIQTAKKSGDVEDIEEAARSLERVDKLIDDLTTVHSFSVKSRDVFETVSNDAGRED